MRKVLLFSGKNNDVNFAVNFMRNWFYGDTKLSEVSNEEVDRVYNMFFKGNKEDNK